MIDLMELLSRMMAFLLLSLSIPLLNNHLAALSRHLLYDSLVVRLIRYCFIPPTERSIDILLSLRMISRSLGDELTLLSPSKARPPLMAPSPITATTCRLPFAFTSPLSLRSTCALCSATAIPSAAEMLFEACPQVKVSYSLSAGEGKG